MSDPPRKTPAKTAKRQSESVPRDEAVRIAGSWERLTEGMASTTRRRWMGTKARPGMVPGYHMAPFLLAWWRGTPPAKVTEIQRPRELADVLQRIEAMYRDRAQWQRVRLAMRLLDSESLSLPDSLRAAQGSRDGAEDVG